MELRAGVNQIDFHMEMSGCCSASSVEGEVVARRMRLGLASWNLLTAG